MRRMDAGVFRAWSRPLHNEGEVGTMLGPGEGERMSGVDDIIAKGKKLLDDNRDKIEEALRSE